MKLKLVMKAIGAAIGTVASLWSIGACIGWGFRDGEKISDTFDMCFYDIFKARKLKSLQNKLRKLSKKEQLTEDEKEQLMELTHDVEDWTSFNTREAATLGTHIVGGFDIHHKEGAE